MSLSLFSTKKVHLVTTSKVLNDDLLGSDSDEDDVADEKMPVVAKDTASLTPFNYKFRTYPQPKELSFSIKVWEEVGVFGRPINNIYKKHKWRV